MPQDDERERELVRMFNLRWDPAHQRSGVDATLDLQVGDRLIRFDVEVKSTTGGTVSTARDVGMDHIRRWRRMLFVIGFYSKSVHRPELLRAYCLTPIDMEPWIASVESYIAPDFELARRASRRLELTDLFDICGERLTYPIADAKRLHKMQWRTGEYEAALDALDGEERRVSQSKMLEVLRLRAQYIAERGSTLNNPHISAKHLRQFEGTASHVLHGEWAAAIRRIALGFASAHPDHPSIQTLSDTL